MKAIAAAVMCALGASTRADWVAINLTPPGMWDAAVYAVSPTQQFGAARSLAPPSYLEPLIWSGSPTAWTSLSSAGIGGAIYGAQGQVQVGVGGPGAAMWNGTPGSLVDLHPAGMWYSEARAVSGNHQYGWTQQTVTSQHLAAMWSGSVGTYVNMNPPGATVSEIYAAAGNLQGGAAAFGLNTGGRAGVWSGTPGSFVSLHPGAPWASSEIKGMTETEQVGAAYLPFPNGFPRAALWHGTAASFVLMDPPEAHGYSELFATCGSAQVGYIAPASGIYAGIWFGTAASFQNLGQYLPAGFGDSYATSIATDGVNYYVGGYAENVQTLRSEAFLWIGPVPAPSTAVPIGLLSLVAFPRRRGESRAGRLAQR